MSTQIENLQLAYNEVLYHTATTLDELASEKTVNLILNNSYMKKGKLNESIKLFDKALDLLVVQLDSLQTLEIKIKRDAYVKEQEKTKANNPQEILRKQKEKIQEPWKPEENDSAQIPDNAPNCEGVPDIMDDINDFLNKVPDTSEFNFGDNIQSYIESREDGVEKFDNLESQNNFENSIPLVDHSISMPNKNSISNSNNVNDNGNNTNFVEENNDSYDFDEQNNFLEDIDSMLNL